MEHKNINQNVMPEFDILPHPLRRVAGVIISLVSRLTSSEEPRQRSADDLLFDEQLTFDYEGEE